MKYEDYVFLYETNLSHIKRMFLSKFKSNDYLNGMLNELQSLMGNLIFCVEDIPLIDLNGENPVLKYRGKEFKVETDDYGQQLFIEYNGHTISGGAFNPSPDIYFMTQLNDILDEEFLFKE